GVSAGAFLPDVDDGATAIDAAGVMGSALLASRVDVPAVPAVTLGNTGTFIGATRARTGISSTPTMTVNHTRCRATAGARRSSSVPHQPIARRNVPLATSPASPRGVTSWR